MHSPMPLALPSAHVVALYSASALSFDLSNGATFADLADRLNHLGDGHAGSPTAIVLTFARPPAPALPSRYKA